MGVEFTGRMARRALSSLDPPTPILSPLSSLALAPTLVRGRHRRDGPLAPLSQLHCGLVCWYTERHGFSATGGALIGAAGAARAWQAPGQDDCS